MTGYSLTPIQSKVLAFLRESVGEDGIAPNFPEIAVAIGLSPKSKSAIFRILNCLEERGHIHRLKKKSRAIAFGPRPETPRCPYCNPERQI